MRLHKEVRSLLNEIELYRTQNGVAETKFGKEATNNEHLIRRIKAGRVPTLETIKRVRNYMKKGNGRKSVD